MSLASFLRFLTDEIDPVPSPGIVQLKLSPKGREVFTPALLAGRVYRLTFAGVYEWHSQNHGQCKADATYREDYQGNITVRYDGVFVDGRPANSGYHPDNWEENRAKHEYSCLIDGHGGEIPVRLHGPDNSYGHIALRIELLPIGTPSVQGKKAVADRAEAANRQRLVEDDQRRQEELKAAKEAEQRKCEAEKAAVRQNALREKALRLRLAVRHQRNFLDDEYCGQFAARFRAEILTEYRQVWTEEYEALMKDQELVGVLKQAAPEVLDWHERRIGVLLQAERLQLRPPDVPGFLHGPSRLTARTIPYIQGMIGRLFELRAGYDALRLNQALANDGELNREPLDCVMREMSFHVSELSRFGISASSPEDAEVQFWRMLPPAPKPLPLPEPAPTFYETLRDRIEAGEQVSPDAITERLEDLYREKIILSAKRRAVIRSEEFSDAGNIDLRLETIRREATDWKTLLEARGIVVEFKRYRDMEESREELFHKLMRERRNIIEALAQSGEEEIIEHVKALYTQKQAQLFEADTQSYT